jgi:hypothetical protein
MNEEEFRAAVAQHGNSCLTEAQAAEVSKISRRTLAHLRLIGAGAKHIRHGRVVRYRASDLEAYLRPMKPSGWAIRVARAILHAIRRATSAVGWWTR